eukprot:TRINITY_DN704_c0_g1_i1.p1 TRINITY_DN704_c0_g1~~TRINITY_DN704_c0_g1_i1.p1  ORF type:complete len:672 (+),score=115.26 TRINITY_DN704_c0_g1_i1:1336-3351(+)
MGNTESTEAESLYTPESQPTNAGQEGIFDELVSAVSQWAEGVTIFGEEKTAEGSWWPSQAPERAPERPSDVVKVKLSRPDTSRVAPLTRSRLQVRWAYGFSSNARNEFSPEVSAVIESHFTKMREVENTPIDLEIEVEDNYWWRIDFFNMRATCEKLEGIYSWDLVRVFPDTQFVPYNIPKKGDDLEYLNTAPIPVSTDDLFPLFLRWDGSDSAWESYAKPMWGLYSIKENKILEKSYQDWITNGTKDVNYKIDAAYSISFRAMVQYRTGNVYRQRPTKRILFRWYWKGDNDKWIPYSEEHSTIIERALVTNRAEVEIDVEGEKYDLNLLEMTQCHSSSSIKIRPILRVGPPLAQQVLVINDNEETSVVLHIDQSFPKYWTLPCKSVSKVPLNFKTSSLGKEIGRMMNSTIFKAGHGGLGTLCGKDPKGFELTSIHIIQNPTMWSNYMYQKGKVMSSFNSKKNDEFRYYMADHPFATPSIDNTCNEVYLFHGNKDSAIEMMCNDGFGISFRNAVISGFGGLYFAENSSTANMYAACSFCNSDQCSCSDKYQEEAEFSLLLCRVILGNVYTDTKFSHSEYDRRTKSPTTGMGYHSIMGIPPAPHLPRELIVTNHSSVYPEFLIRYKRKAEPQVIELSKKTVLGINHSSSSSEEEKEVHEDHEEPQEEGVGLE